MALAVKFHQHILQEGGQVLLNTAVSDIDILLKIMLLKKIIELYIIFDGHNREGQSRQDYREKRWSC